MTTASAHPSDPGSDRAEVRVARGGAGPLTVSVTMPADLVHLSVARAIGASLGAALDFDLDTIADLRMAVDEMASILITRAAEGAEISLSFAAANDLIEVSGRVPADDPAPIDQETFGWAVLTALVREVWSAAEPADDGRTSLLVKLEIAPDRGGS